MRAFVVRSCIMHDLRLRLAAASPRAAICYRPRGPSSRSLSKFRPSQPLPRGERGSSFQSCCAPYESLERCRRRHETAPGPPTVELVVMVLTLVGAAQLECAHAGCSLRALPAGQSFAEASTSTEERRMMEGGG